MTPSFVQGLDTARLRFETIGQALDETTVKWGAHDALIVRHQNIRWTYTELKQRVDALAAGFLALGLSPGDRIGIWAPNCCEWALTQFASAKAGLILVNLNPAYRAPELQFALNKVGCRALVVAERFKNTTFLEVLRSIAPQLEDCAPNELQAARLPQLRCVIRLGLDHTRGCFNFTDVTKLGQPQDYARLQELADEIQPDDACNIQLPAAPRAHPRAPHSVISTSSTTATL
jgi:fatty-acyl-CoA synthase